MGAPWFVSNRFEILRQLGAGGMGVVYEALDRETGERVALKTLQQQSANSLYRFKNEFRAIRDIRHPNLVRLLELHAGEDQWFFTMELVLGCTLREAFRPSAARPRDAAPALDDDGTGDTDPGALRASLVDPLHTAQDVSGPDAATVAPRVREESQTAPPLEWSRLRHALAQVAEAIHALHTAHKVHRDLKPANILVTEDDRVVLLDFGLILDVNTAEGTDENIAGTVAYMAPEQSTGERVGPPADWYSLGVILYQLLTDRLPFPGRAAEVLVEKRLGAPEVPRWLAKDAPVDLCQLATDLMQPNPELRPGYEEVRARLGAGRTVSGSGPRREGPRGVVGREGELEAMRGAVARVVGKRSAAVLLTGPSGSGKTALLDALFELERQEHPEMIVLRTRGRRDERVPFQAIDELVDALSHALLRVPPTRAARIVPRHATDLVALFPVLRRVGAVDALGPTDTQLPPDQRRASAFDALGDILRNLAKEQLLVLVVEDAEHVDRDSATELHRLLTGERAPAALVLATARLVAGRDERSLAALGLPPTCRLVALEPLSDATAAALVRHLAPTLSPAQIVRYVEAGRGHAADLCELVEHGRRVTDTTRLTLDDAVRVRIDGLDPAARAVLEALALVGDGREVSLARITGLEVAKIRAPVTELEAARLVRLEATDDRRLLECVDERVRAVVVGALSEDRKTLYREAALRWFQSDADAPVGVVVALLESTGAREAAVERLMRAVDGAERQLAFDRAAELVEEAIRIGAPAADDEADLRDRAARCLAFSGDLSGAGTQLEHAARKTSEPSGRVARLARAAMHHASCYDARSMRRATEAGLALLGMRYPTGLVQLAGWTIRGLVGSLFGALLARRAESEDALARRRAVHAFAMAMQIGSYVTNDLALGGASTFTVIAAGMRLGDSIERVRGVWAESVLFASMGLRRLAERRLVLMRSIAQRVDEPTTRGAASFGATVSETKLGHFERAELEAERGLSFGPWMDAFEYVGMATRVGLVLFLTGHVVRGIAWTQRGISRVRPGVRNALLEICRDTVEVMHAILGRPNDGLVRFAALSDEPEWHHGRVQFGVGMGLLYVYETEHEGPEVDALLRIHETSAVPTSHPADEILVQYVAATYVHARRALAGRHGAAADLGRSLRRARGVSGWRSLGAHLRVLEAAERITRGDHEGALRALDLAEHLARETDNPWVTFESILMRTRCFVRMGFERDARIHLQMALALSEAQGWVRRSERARHELGSLLDRD